MPVAVNIAKENILIIINKSCFNWNLSKQPKISFKQDMMVCNKIWHDRVKRNKMTFV